MTGLARAGNFGRALALARTRKVSLLIASDSSALLFNGGLVRGYQKSIKDAGLRIAGAPFLPHGRHGQVSGGDTTRHFAPGVHGASMSGSYAYSGAGAPIDRALPLSLMLRGSAGTMVGYVGGAAGTVNTMYTLKGTGAPEPDWATQVQVGPHDMQSAANLRLHWAYGIFASGGGSSQLRKTNSTTPLGGARVSHAGGSDGVLWADYDISAATPANDIAVTWGWDASNQVLAKAASLGAMITDQSATAGVIVQPWHAAGSTTTADIGAATTGLFVAVHADHYALMAEMMRRQQGVATAADVVAIIVWSFGMNDWNDAGGTVRLTKTQYKENLDRAVAAAEAGLVAAGVPAASITHVLQCCHPHSNATSQSYIPLYGEACRELAAERSRCTGFDPTERFTSAQFLAASYYNNGGADNAHLTEAGYRKIADCVVDGCLPRVAAIGGQAAGLPVVTITRPTGYTHLVVERKVGADVYLPQTPVPLEHDDSQPDAAWLWETQRPYDRYIDVNAQDRAGYDTPANGSVLRYRVRGETWEAGVRVDSGPWEESPEHTLARDLVSLPTPIGGWLPRAGTPEGRIVMVYSRGSGAVGPDFGTGDTNGEIDWEAEATTGVLGRLLARDPDLPIMINRPWGNEAQPNAAGVWAPVFRRLRDQADVNEIDTVILNPLDAMALGQDAAGADGPFRSWAGLHQILGRRPRYAYVVAQPPTVDVTASGLAMGPLLSWIRAINAVPILDTFGNVPRVDSRTGQPTYSAYAGLFFEGSSLPYYFGEIGGSAQYVAEYLASYRKFCPYATNDAMFRVVNGRYEFKPSHAACDPKKSGRRCGVLLTTNKYAGSGWSSGVAGVGTEVADTAERNRIMRARAEELLAYDDRMVVFIGNQPVWDPNTASALSDAEVSKIRSAVSRYAPGRGGGRFGRGDARKRPVRT